MTSDVKGMLFLDYELIWEYFDYDYQSIHIDRKCSGTAPKWADDLVMKPMDERRVRLVNLEFFGSRYDDDDDQSTT